MYVSIRLSELSVSIFVVTKGYQPSIAYGLKKVIHSLDMPASFISKENVNLLWEVVTNALNLQHSSAKFVAVVQDVFNQHITLFASSSEPSLRELNKQFLAKLMSGLNQLFPHLKRIHIDTAAPCNVLVDAEVLPSEPTDAAAKKKVTWEEPVDSSVGSGTTYENQHSVQLPPVEREIIHPSHVLPKGTEGNVVLTHLTTASAKVPTFHDIMKRLDELQRSVDLVLGHLNKSSVDCASQTDNL